MDDDLLIRLNPPAHRQLRALMKYYGEATPEQMISRALGLLQMVEPYVGPDGALTVVTPHPEPDGGDREIDLVFDNFRRAHPGAADGSDKAR